MLKAKDVENEQHLDSTKDMLEYEEKIMKDPLAQAERSKFTFVDLLADRQTGFHSYWVESAVWFPSVPNQDCIGKMPPAYVPEIVLSERDLSSVKYSIEKIYDYYSMDAKPFYTQKDEEHVINCLSPSFNAIPSIANVIDEQERVFNRMTDEQSYLLDYLEEQNIAAIQGGAGTGKTMLALEKAKRVSKSGKVLFLCFNKLLLDSLKLSNINSEYDIEFYNLPGLVCAELGVGDAGGNIGIRG